jgi:hypothetical protein
LFRNRVLAALTAAVLLLGVTAVSAGAAQAGEQVLHDARADMWQSDFSGGPAREAPGTAAGDVRRAVFLHGPRNVVIRQKYLDLRRVGQYALYSVRLQTGSNLYREVRVETRPGSWGGTARVFNGRGDRTPCATTHRIDYDTNLLVIALPRSCLGTPSLVRGTATGYWADQSRQVFLMDNPHSERANPGGWTRWLRAG